MLSSSIRQVVQQMRQALEGVCPELTNMFLGAHDLLHGNTKAGTVIDMELGLLRDMADDRGSLETTQL